MIAYVLDLIAIVVIVGVAIALLGPPIRILLKSYIRKMDKIERTLEENEDE